jgi:DNA ligase-1
MRRWSEVAERIAATTRTSEKTRLLSQYLVAVDAAALAPAVVFFSGRAFPEADTRALGLGWATLADAVTRVAGVSRADLGAAYDRYSDLGRAVGDVLAARDAAIRNATGANGAVPGGANGAEPGGANGAEPGGANGAEPGGANGANGAVGGPPAADGGPTVPEVAAAFAAIEAARGPAAKAAVFEELLRRCDPLSATYLVKILGGELRIGLREGLVEAAIARAFDRPAADVSRAVMLTGDVGEAAALARDGRLGEARLRLFHPLRFMLASPAEDAAEIIDRLGPEVWTEDKYDGIRAQLHRRGAEVRLFSRDLHDVSGQFPEVVEAARGLDWDGILDGEILAFRDGSVLPFLALQKRLGRKAPPEALLAEVPVAFVAFDALALGPRDGVAVPLLEEPLRERRARLEALGLDQVDPARFALSRLATARSTDELERIFAAARARRNEGLMVKDPASPYSPGRRGYGWLKMKKALATLDCVVVGVEVGHGKRHGVLSDYTFAVRDEASGTLATIGKAYSGLTDAEIADLTRWFEAHTISRHGRYRVVEPEIVVEVAFDVIMRSARHASGFALRFPRIARVRDDKPVAEIDTLETVTRLWRDLQAGAEHLVTQEAARAIRPPVPDGDAPGADADRPPVPGGDRPPG